MVNKKVTTFCSNIRVMHSFGEPRLKQASRIAASVSNPWDKTTEQIYSLSATTCQFSGEVSIVIGQLNSSAFLLL